MTVVANALFFANFFAKNPYSKVASFLLGVCKKKNAVFPQPLAAPHFRPTFWSMQQAENTKNCGRNWKV